MTRKVEYEPETMEWIDGPKVVRLARMQGRGRNAKTQSCGYGEVNVFGKRLVLVMGNTAVRRNGEYCFWVADYDSGAQLWAGMDDLRPWDQAQPPFHEIVARIEGWAAEGQDSAMWWLGHFYGPDSDDNLCGACKSLAYYLAAMRLAPDKYTKEVQGVTLRDWASTFTHPGRDRHRLPKDVKKIVQQFTEFRDFEKNGTIYLPDSRDWKECIEIASNCSPSQS